MTLAKRFAQQSPQWGLSPEEWAKRIKMGKECDRYVLEECTPLPQDPVLQQAGVEVCARVTVSPSEPRPKTEIAFLRKDEKGMTHEGKVTCTHVALGKVPVCEVAEHPEQVAKEFAISTERRPVTLAPQEHFAALWSYVAGIAEEGITTMFQSGYSPTGFEQIPFGFNAAMRAQVLDALTTIAPAATCDLVAQALEDLIQHTTPEWRRKRASLVEKRYNLFALYDACPPEYREIFDKATERQYYVIESHDVNIPDVHRTYGIYTTPGLTNMSHEARVKGWLGTTGNVSETAHGVFASLAAARAKIQQLTPGMEIIEKEDGGDIDAIEEWGYTNIWTSADWFANSSDNDLGIAANTTDEQLAALAEKFEAEALAEGVVLEDDVAGYLTERRDSAREEEEAE